MSYTVERKPKSTAELSFSVLWEELRPHIEREAKELGKDLKVPGFRPGKIPTDVVRQKFSDFEILEKQLEPIIGHLYYEAVQAEKLLTLGRPDISILKMADGNPFEFRAVVALVPKVTPANFRELSVEARAIVIEEQEITNALEELRRMRATQDHKNTENPKTQKQETGNSQQETVNKESETPGTGSLPELNDEFAKSLGKFENLDALKKALFENLKAEKEYEESIRQENALIDLLIEKSEFEDLPEILLASELEQVFHEFKHNIEHRGINFSEWLGKIQKSESTFKKSLEPQAEKRARSSLVLRAIAEAERIEPSEDEVKEEITSLLQQYPNPKQQEKFAKPEFVDYFRRVLISKKTMKFLKEIMIKKSESL